MTIYDKKIISFALQIYSFYFKKLVFEESKIRSTKSLEHLYLVIALAILFVTSQGMAVQIKVLRADNKQFIFRLVCC